MEARKTLAAFYWTIIFLIGTIVLFLLYQNYAPDVGESFACGLGDAQNCQALQFQYYFHLGIGALFVSMLVALFFAGSFACFDALTVRTAEEMEYEEEYEEENGTV
jgi:hypothetical protein